MVLTLYGHPFSSCTRRAALVLYEKQIPFNFEIVRIDIGEHKAPVHMEKQPFGQVPYIDDDGFVLYESRAIARYLAEKYADQGTSLIPADPKAKALMEQAASCETSNFDAHLMPIIVETVIKPNFLKLTTDAAIVEEKAAILGTKLDVYEQILSKQKYLGGDEFTLADLFHIPAAAVLPMTGVDLPGESRPNVARWIKDLLERESWLAIKDGNIAPIAA